MNVTTGRVVFALAVAVCFLGLGMLEVLSERAGMERAFTTPPRPDAVEKDPAWDTMTLPESSNPAPDASRLTMAIQAGRVIVLTVDEKRGRLLSVSGSGPVLESEVGHETVVMTEDKQAGRLALLKPGDVIRIEPAAGEIQKIVLLRHAWRQLESPEQ
jgi:hypothetical protein